MIELYMWGTPNGRKPAIMLEEIGLPYRVHTINIGREEQFDPDFLKIAPNNKIPAIVDSEGPGGPLSVFESGAILIYLAEKTGKLLAPSGPERYSTLAWMNWHTGGVAPTFGQLGFFAVRAEEKSELAIKRFTDEGERLLGVMDRRLDDSPYLAGPNYTIADIINYPWILAGTTYLEPALGSTLRNCPSVMRWLETVGAREAVKRGMATPKV